MSTATFGKAAKKFTDAGIKGKWLLPIAPVGGVIGKNAVISPAVLGKAPGRFSENRGVWSGLGGRAIFDGVTKSDFAEFQDWPTPNVGILGRAFPAIDNDAGSDKARRLVEKVMFEAFGDDAVYGERIRGKNDRRLYAFKCYDPEDLDIVVKTRHLTYKLADDDQEHKLDVIGLGGQYVACGIHPSGDEYGWDHDYSLMDEYTVSHLTEIDNADMQRFIELFIAKVEKTGGEIVRATGGRSTGFEARVRDLEPVMSVETVMAGLAEIPNTEENFIHRDDFVAALSAVRSALGEKTLDRDVEDQIYAWATQDPDWCDDEYFEKVWNSLEVVRTPQDSLDRLFRRNGVMLHVKDNFDNNAPKINSGIKKKKAKALDEREELLETVASRYIFGRISLRDGNSQYVMRDVWDVDHDWPTIAWWKGELAESDNSLILALQEFDNYPANKIGLANFLRDMAKFSPDSFFSKEVRHPSYEKGEIFPEVKPDGSILRSVNMRFLSQTIREARKDDKNASRSQEDLAHILDFSKRLFGKMVDYELDTLAYMAQTGDRPGNLLFIVGDPGVGKSLWMAIQETMFDGTGPEQSASIDGQKLHNESARRFMFARAEGCRIVSIKELPESAGARDMAAITSLLKQVVDAGPAGDWLQIERKGQDIQNVRNFARVLISSNYLDAIHVEQNDRRIFYVASQIREDNKPKPEYYDKLIEILQDPKRLACFWRYLLQRDIGNYSRHSAPPVSTEKAARVLAEITHGPTRHARAVIEWFKVSSRTCFTTAEFLDLMSEVAAAEYQNTGGAVDDRAIYTISNDKGGQNLVAMNALRQVKASFAIKLNREIRSNSHKRISAIYVLNPDLAIEMMSWHREDVIDYVFEEQDKAGMPPHPMAIYRKQTK